MPRLEPVQALQLARAFAGVRILIGVAFLVAPRLAGRALLAGRGPAHGSAVPIRMFAGRELAMGLGAALAARRGPHAVRGWVEAGGLADGIDAAAFLIDLAGGRATRTTRGGTALLIAITAGTAAGTAPVLARALPPSEGSRRARLRRRGPQ